MAAHEKSRRSKRRNLEAEDLLRLELVGDPQISPDGGSILFTKKHVGDKNDYVTNLWVVDSATGAARQFTSSGKDSGGRWSPDGQTIVFVSAREKPISNIFSIPAAGGEATALTNFPEGSFGTMKWSPDGTQLAVAFRETEAEWTDAAKQEREETGASIPARVIDDMYYRLDGDGYFNAARFQLVVVDVATGAHRTVFDRDTNGWFNFDWSPDSRELVVSANTHRDALLKPWKVELFRIDALRGKARKISDIPTGMKSAVAWSPDGRRIAFAGREGKETWGVNNTRLYVCDADGGNVRDLTGDEDYCLSAVTLSDTAEASFDEKLLWSPDGCRIYLQIGWHGETHVASIAAAGGRMVFHSTGRQSIDMGNLSSDGRRLALAVADQQTLAEVAVGALPKNPTQSGSLKINKLTDFNQSLLDELQLAKGESTWIESASGTKIHVWVMKPPGFKPGKKYPTVLQVHGGPHTQYGEAFFHEFQFLAAKGFVVVFSNPRGSKGYGEDHCTAIKGNWGNADWEDVQAVIKHMKQLPFVNANRMGIMGGSYGGYMTNWAIGHTDEFAGAITDRCVSNLVSMVGSSDLPLVPGEYWEGNSWDNTEDVWEQSPLKHFGNVKTPTLIMHSEGDLRCNVEQSEQVFAALKLRGIPTRFVRYPSTTSHGMSRKGPPDLRLHRLGQILEWWKKYLS